MGRLTERNESGKAISKTLEFQYLIDKLAEYEDAEEQGLLLRLPCKVGDDVYYIYQFKDNMEIVILHDEVEFINIRKNNIVIKTVTDDYFNVEDFRKIVFLTREEAEQALAEMQKG